MIERDQPTIFPRGVKVVFSSAEDGSTAMGGGKASNSSHVRITEEFLKKHGFDESNRTKVAISYGPNHTYTESKLVTPNNIGTAVECDALYTTGTQRIITLPVADCIATVVYDPSVPLLGVLHLGRHSSVAGLIEKFAEITRETLGSNPAHWYVWMSPSLQQASNGLDYFTPPDPNDWEAFQHTGDDGKIYLDIPGHNKLHFERLGVLSENIEVSEVDTHSDEAYFSHRAAESLGKPERQGRMTVVAELVD